MVIVLPLSKGMIVLKGEKGCLSASSGYSEEAGAEDEKQWPG